MTVECFALLTISTYKPESHNPPRTSHLAPAPSSLICAGKILIYAN